MRLAFYRAANISLEQFDLEKQSISLPFDADKTGKPAAQPAAARRSGGGVAHRLDELRLPRLARGVGRLARTTLGKLAK